MEDISGDLPDYKVHVFGGVPRFILVCKDRFQSGGLTEDFYTVDWEHIPLKRPHHPNAQNAITKPTQLTKMLELSTIIAREIPFARVDFYEINNRLYFGEITFYPASGMSSFEPEEWDYTLGDWIKLPPVTQET